MIRRSRTWQAYWLGVLVLLSGCHPTQPFYLHEDGDLSHYLDHATEVVSPDVETCLLPDASESQRPLSIMHPEFDEFWDMTLEEAMRIHLHNSKVIRGLGGLPSPINVSGNLIPDRLVTSPATQVTIYDPSIVETNPNAGVHAALAQFDAQFQIDGATAPGGNRFFDVTNRPNNFGSTAAGFFSNQQTLGGMETSIVKRSVTGTTYAFRNVTNYDRDQTGTASRIHQSLWTTAFETEISHPLLRGSGTMVNRIPILLGRINTDVSIADLEAGIRDSIFDVEKSYWDLYLAYRNLEAQKVGRNSALRSWNKIAAEKGVGKAAVQDEAQAREQYFFFKSQVEQAITDLYNTESNMRFLLGIAATDGRLIRPSEEPTLAKVEFNWFDIHAEALARTVELRRQKWVIKQRELQLIQARNQLLPQLDLVGTYRWVGRGDELGLGSNDGDSFRTPGSSAFNVLTDGAFQEYSLGFLFTPPAFGARAELNNIRNVELNLQRERARLEDMELNVSHLLSRAVREMETQYSLAETHFNRLRATAEEMNSREAIVIHGAQDRGGGSSLDLFLNAQRRRSDAELAYYQSLVGYMKQIAHIHYRKGSYLEYNNIQLAEGPWPDKAYWDALGHARRRDASYYLNYGTTRPSVISRGPVAQHEGQVFNGSLPQTVPLTQSELGSGVDQSVPGGQEILPAPQPTPADEIPQPAPADGFRQPTPADGSPRPTPADGSPRPTPADEPQPLNPGGETQPPQLPVEPNLLQSKAPAQASRGRRVAALAPLRGAAAEGDSLRAAASSQNMVQQASHEVGITKHDDDQRAWRTMKP